jgi:hypothetical protein
MKTKETIDNKTFTLEKTVTTKVKPKSLRPMRSMVAVRSFKPRAAAELVLPKPEGMESRS